MNFSLMSRKKQIAINTLILGSEIKIVNITNPLFHKQNLLNKNLIRQSKLEEVYTTVHSFRQF